MNGDPFYVPVVFPTTDPFYNPYDDPDDTYGAQAEHYGSYDDESDDETEEGA